MFKRRKYSVTLSGENLNDYIEGKISGLIDGIVDSNAKRGYAHWVGMNDDGTSFRKITFEATRRQLRRVMRMLHKRYLGFINIVFEYEGEVS